jgi:Mn2+/Fe2+ NRAMP family transporter
MSIGPGLVFALTILGPGDIFSNAAAGAAYGYSLLWALLLSLLFRYVWVSTSAKYVIVTGESLLSGYARLGKPVLWILFISLLILRHVLNLYLIVILGSASDMLVQLPTEYSQALWSLTWILAALGLMFWGGYRILEFLFKVIVAVLSVSLIVATFLVRPEPASILSGLSTPTIPADAGLYSSLFVLMALIGTESGSMVNLTYAYFIHRKGWHSPAHLKRQRSDLLWSVACIFIFCTLLQTVAAETLRPLGIPLTGMDDLSRILSEGQGAFGAMIFALGLCAAAFTSLVGGTAGFALMITDLCRNFIPRFRDTRSDLPSDSEPERDWIYRASVILWVLSPLYILFLNARPVWLVLFASALMVVLIPVLVACLLRITGDRERMGKYQNSAVTNAILYILLGTSLFLIAKSLYEYIGSIFV